MRQSPVECLERGHFLGGLGDITAVGGAKGAGEGGIIPVAGVIANAVAAALGSLGVAPRELPLSPPRVWQLIRERTAPR